jgi:TPR repeat protein
MYPLGINMKLMKAIFSRCVITFISIISAECAGQNETSDTSHAKASALYEKGLEQVKQGLCAGDKFLIGLGKLNVRRIDQETDLKPKPIAEEGFKLIISAHDAGYADASFTFAKCLEHGILVKENYPEAIRIYRKLSALGHSNSQYELGEELIHGRLASNPSLLKTSSVDSPTDVEGFDWLLKAAESGHPNAQNAAAVCLQQGVGTVRDVKASFKWAQLSAYAGAYSGQFTLAIHYVNAEAVPQDLDRAYAWFKISSEDDEGSMIASYMKKIEPYVNHKRSSDIEAKEREEIAKNKSRSK